MPGEPILVVDDTPVNLKLTRILLVNEGYKVLTAASAEEALELVHSFRPELVLADIQLPGIDGFELTRRLKQNVETQDILVVALTAFATKGDEQKAIDAGCDAYITKPIDTRTLGASIREILSRRSAPPAMDTTPALPPLELHALRRRFVAEGLVRTRQWLFGLKAGFPADEVSKTIHQWIGAGGLLGYSAISRLARDAEALLREPPADLSRLRDSLTNLALAFSNPREAKDHPVPASIVRSLTGKRVALAGFAASTSERLAMVLATAHVERVVFDAARLPSGEELRGCDLVVVQAGSPHARALESESELARIPLVLAGSQDELLALDPSVQALARECLVEPWELDDALLRLSLALARREDSKPAANKHAVKPTVLIADHDPTILALVRASTEHFGMDCQTAPDGRVAIEAIRRDLPHAAVLDVNMTGMDGYEILAAVRAESLQVRVLLLTARQEQDILRGFTLGADDYIVKPFNPVELIVRVKRLLG